MSENAVSCPKRIVSRLLQCRDSHVMAVDGPLGLLLTAWTVIVHPSQSTRFMFEEPLTVVLSVLNSM